MKLIFLDFDGVLNDHAFLTQRRNHPAEGVVFPELAGELDPVRISLINLLIEETGANIVISSSWRTNHSLEEMNSAFEMLGGTFKAIGVTPRIPGNQNRDERGNEIHTFIDTMKVKPESFIILDDETDMGELFPFLIKTSFFGGFTESHLQEAIKRLGKK